MENITTTATRSVMEYKMKNGKRQGRYRIYDVYDIVDTRTVIKNGKEVALTSSRLQKVEHNLDLGFNHNGSPWGQRVQYREKYKVEATTTAQRFNIEKQFPETTQKASAGATYQKSRRYYSNRQIAIAYQVMGILITKNNATDIMKKYSANKSVQKFLSNSNISNDAMTFFSDYKHPNTKLLHDLYAAKTIIVGKKKQKASDEINRIIADFEARYERKYGKL